MRRVIIESPYAGDIERNTTYARSCMRDSVLRGEAPLASHLLYTQPGILLDNIPEERKLGIDAGFAWRPFAEYSVFYTDLGWSRGMLSALWEAIERDLPFKIRALKNSPILPETLDEDIFKLLKSCVEK